MRYLDDDDDFGGDDRLFPGGYGQVVDALATGLDVRLGEAVERIALDGDRVVVTSSRAEHTAEWVIVTVPLGVLQAGTITFAPELPATKQRAIAELRMGTLDKVAVRFPHRFWPADRHFLAYASTVHGQFPEILDLHRHTGEAVLVALVGGSFARTLEDRPDDEIAGGLLDVLARVTGAPPPAPLAVTVSRWNRDRFALGSYSHVPVGATAAAFDVLAEPVAGRIFFAGEATHRRHRGTVPGAYLSGLREAARIAAP